MTKHAITSILFCLLMACNANENNKTVGERVFLDLFLGSTREDVVSHLNSLEEKGEIKNLDSYILGKKVSLYEYPFFVKTTEFKSFLSLSFCSHNPELLKSVVVEIQDPKKQLTENDLKFLIQKKYGAPIDSSTMYHFYNLKDPYYSYSWKIKDKIEITLSRDYISTYIGDSTQDVDIGNYFKISYSDIELVWLDAKKQIIESNHKLNEKQNKVENDL